MMSSALSTFPLTVSQHNSIAEIDPAAWDACAGKDNPFVSHAFFRALEESGSTGRKTGWLPAYTAFFEEDRVAAVAPAYVKTHSYGEYVFDQGWAEAMERAGGTYYPKLQIAVPFSPVPGPRLLIRPGSSIDQSAIAAGLEEVCRRQDLSSAHATFCSEAEWQKLGAAGWLQRLGLQYHWQNDGYKTFDDFLATLSSRKRKAIKRERRDANNAGLTFRTLRGEAIEPQHWRAFYEFYTSTVDRKWGSAYLTPAFFPLLSKYLGDKVVLMLAEQAGVPVAGALNLHGRDTLYGRNWGGKGNFPFLHFELCYYRAIDYAIEHNLKRVEAGAQGEHKLQRGYLPQPTYSAHWISHKGLRSAVAQFLQQERRGIEAAIGELAGASPFKQKD